jgi:hypothetical protein
MALLYSIALLHLYHLPYNHGSTQQLTIYSSDRGRSFLLDHAPSCLNCLHSKLICDRLRMGVVSGSQLDEGQVGVVTLAD